MRRATSFLSVALVLAAALSGVRADEGSSPRERLLVLDPRGLPAARVLLTRTEDRVRDLPVLDAAAPGEARSLVRGLLDPLPERRRGDERTVIWGDGVAAVVLPHASGASTVGLRLAPAARLRGRVLFARGAAAGQLEILGLPASGRGVVHRTKTLADGSWRLDHLAPGRWEISVRRGDGRIQRLGVFGGGDPVGALAIDEGARIRGRVLDGHASEVAPQPGVRLRLLPLPRTPGDDERVPVEVTDADGGFEVRDLVPGVYEARPADPTLYFDPSPPRFEARPRRDVELRPFFAMRLGEVEGRVVDVEDRGVAGATVRLLPDATDDPPPEGWPPMPAAVADEDGRFRLEGVRPLHRYRLVLSASGHAPVVTRPFDVGRVLPFLHPPVQLPRGWRLEARLRRAGGKPVPDAPVRVIPAAHPVTMGDPIWALLAREGRTNAEGRVVLADLPAEDVRVVAGGGVWLETVGLVPYPRTGDVRTWTGTLFPAPVLTGRLVGEDAERIPVLRLVALPRDGSGSRDVRVEGDGRFRIEGLPAVPTDLEVTLGSHPEGPPLARYEGALPGGGRDLEILVPRRRRIAGRAIGLSGEGPPAHALLEAPRLDVDEDRYAWRTVRRVRIERSALDAPFAFEDLAPGAYAVRVVQGHVDSGTESVLLDRADVTELEIELPAAGRIAGTVLGDRDLPVLGSLVSLVRLRGDGDAPGGAGLLVREATDADGAFVFGAVAPGLWRVEARDRHRASDSLVVRVGEGETVLTRDLLLGRGGTLEGTVRDSRGRLLDGARVELEALTDGVDDRVVVSSENGVVRADELPPGLWRVTLRSRAGAFTDLELLLSVVRGETTTFDLRAEGRAEIRGTVRRKGLPVGDVTLELLRRPQGAGEPAQRLTARTDAAGIFSWEGLAAGRYQVDVVDGVVRSSRAVEVVEGDRRDLDLEVWEGRLPGRVLTLAGRGVAGATVVATPVGDASDVAIAARGRTDPAGRFVLAGLPVGLYDLAVDPLGLPPGRLRAVRADVGDAARTATVVLGAGGNVDVDVFDPDGRGVIGARIWLEDEGGRALHARPFTTSGGGRLRLTGVPAGGHWLRVQASRYGQPGRLSVRVSEGETTAVKFDLGPPGSIRLVVEGEDRNPVTRVRVALVRTASGEAVEVRRTLWPIRLQPVGGVLPRTGYRLFEDLAAGSYTVRLDAGSAYEARVVPVQVAAGEETLVEVVLSFVEDR